MTFDTYEEAFVWCAAQMGMTVDEYDAFIKAENERARQTYSAYTKRQISTVKRTRIFCRDLHQCQYCGARDKPLAVDHIVPEALGGSHDDSNLITACQPCNASKGIKSLEEWKRGKQ
jgi:5-methylcytosine-specific restriction endonuclease McrA